MSRSPLWVILFLIQTLVLVMFVIAFSRSGAEFYLYCQSNSSPRQLIALSAEAPNTTSCTLDTQGR